MKKIIIILISLILLACKNENPQQRTINPAAGKSILVSYNSTEYKEKLVSMIINNYQEDFSIEIIPLKSLKKIKPDDYNAVIIMDACEAALFFNPELKNFVKNKNTSNLVLFITKGDPEWKWENEDIAAITSASSDASLQPAFRQIKDKLDTLLK